MQSIAGNLPPKLTGSLNTAVLAVGPFSEEQMTTFNKVASRQRDQHAFFLVQDGTAFNLRCDQTIDISHTLFTNLLAQCKLAGCDQELQGVPDSHGIGASCHSSLRGASF